MTTDINNRPACYVPWVTRYEYANGNITPCCEFDPDMKINITENMSLEDSFDHPKMKALRTQLLTCDKNDIDALPSGCSQCKVFEKAGTGSMRQAIARTVKVAEQKDVISKILGRSFYSNVVYTQPVCTHPCHSGR